MQSIWEKSVQMPAFPRLEGERRTDVLVIGGGLAGVLCAHSLRKAGANCILIEAEQIGSGATARTTAKLTSQHGLVYGKLVNKFGPGAARAYWEVNEAALGAFGAEAREVDCDFEIKDHCVYSCASVKALEEEAAVLEGLSIPFEFVEKTGLPFQVKGGIRFRDQAQFHPMKFLAGIVPGLEIYEHTRAREFVGNTVVTDHGKITAETIIIATHFPILNKHGGYFLKLYQQRSYVLAVENAMTPEGMYLAAEEGGFSFRNHGDVLLLGQGSHRTGKKSAGWQPAEDFVRRQFPAARVVAKWANQDCMTLDGLPYIGRYGRSTPNLYVATGFNKWGMTGSMAAAMILKDLVQGKRNPYEELFLPQRSMLHPQLAVNALESTTHLLMPTKPRCPHLGCALKWNPNERSWDCPCHGSRFSETGELLNDPATDDLPDK